MLHNLCKIIGRSINGRRRPPCLPKAQTRVQKAKTVDRKANSIRRLKREGGRGRKRQRCRTGASRKRAATGTHLIGLWAKSCHSTTIPMTHPHDRHARHARLGSEPAWPATNCNRISQGAQQLFTKRERERQREWERESMENRKQSKATARHLSPFTRLRLRLGLRLRLLYHFRLASGWRLRTAFKSGRA